MRLPLLMRWMTGLPTEWPSSFCWWHSPLLFGSPTKFSGNFSPLPILWVALFNLPLNIILSFSESEHREEVAYQPLNSLLIGNGSSSGRGTLLMRQMEMEEEEEEMEELTEDEEA